VVGSGILLHSAAAAWAELDPALELRTLAIDPQGGRAAWASALDSVELDGASAFVAVDAQFLNFRRLELVDMLRQRGVPMPPLVSSTAYVGAGIEIQENCWIGHGAIIQHGCRIGANVVIGAGAIVGAGTEIRDAAWIDEGVTVGREARIGANASLGLGVVIGHGVAVGDLSIIDKPGRIEADVAARTFIHASHANPIVVTGN
jgi:acyl-[acyl carrier protein]--UDP-N-acetylglucosamine O-acyltransferase